MSRKTAMNRSDRWGLIIFIFSAVLLVTILWPLTAVYDRLVYAAQHEPPVINCKGGNVIQPLVRDYDGRLWRVDVCAVAQNDQDGLAFKTEVKR